MRTGVNWIDDRGRSRLLRLDDVLVVAPYNAQVSDLSNRFRTREQARWINLGAAAPVVIYSLTTSSPEDAPRGMEFLYSLNRLNVATSRAQAGVIVVGSPRLLEPECRSPRQCSWRVRVAATQKWLKLSRGHSEAPGLNTIGARICPSTAWALSRASSATTYARSFNHPSIDSEFLSKFHRIGRISENSCNAHRRYIDLNEIQCIQALRRKLRL